MDPNTYLVMALLKSVAHQHKMQETTVIAEPEFAPLNVLYLKDSSGQDEHESDSPKDNAEIYPNRTRAGGWRSESELGASPASTSEQSQEVIPTRRKLLTNKK